jgi:ATP-dependent protease ClpP protease subunit
MKKLFQLLRANATAPAPLRAETVENTAVLYIYDVIDSTWGVKALDVVKFIAGLKPEQKLAIRINSPGGDVFEARAIATAIKNHPGEKVAYIDGLAASAATTISLSVDRVEIAEGSFFMIHNAWTMAMGDKNSLMETAALLDKVDDAIANDYAKKTGATRDDIAGLMNAETWLSAQEAVEKKFADAIQGDNKDSKNNLNKWDLSAYDNAPQIKQESNFEQVRALNEKRLRLLSII